MTLIDPSDILCEKEKEIQSKACVLLYGRTPHYIDHLAPLSVYLDIPLVVTEIEYKKIIETYYPDVKLLYFSFSDLLRVIGKRFIYLISSLPKAYLDEAFSYTIDQGKREIHYIWTPHGNSDKGWKSRSMQALERETLLLIYGDRMKEFLEKMEVKTPSLMIGNYRKWYAKKHRSFYKKLLEREVFSSLKKEKKTLLYAPTWEDGENNSSINCTKKLIETLIGKYNLLIKPHPNTLFQKMEFFLPLEKIAASDTSDKPSVFFLYDLPTIYPLLENVDLYIGDMSSIGYDFLSFDRPLLFLNPEKKEGNSTSLFSSGHELQMEEEDLLFEIENAFRTNNSYTEIRQKMYEKTFSPLLKKEDIYREIRQALFH